MQNVDAHLATLPIKQKAALQHLRAFIKKHLPDAEEAISYGMPAFRYKGKYLVGYYAYADHLSLFPTPGPIVAFKDELADYKTAKGSIHFTLEKPISDELLGKIIDFQKAAIDT